jgi:hypothetical protein
VIKITLTRFAWTPFGTFGQISLPDGQTLFTVEQPWNENKTGESCIPQGKYECKPRPYYRGGYEAIEITKVPGRRYILFHIANVPADVRGCIGVGSHLGWVKGSWAVTSSRTSFIEFMRQLGDGFLLTITNKKDIT